MLRTFALCCAALLPTIANAASLQVSPVLVEIGANEPATTMFLRNTGTELIGAQVRVMKWSQKDGADILEPTRDVVASPPILKINPGGEQTIRLIRASKQPIVSEESYRILVNELPGSGNAQANSVNLLLQYSIPVFLNAAGTTRPQLSWRAQRDGENVKLIVYNSGTRREKLRELIVSLQDGHKVIDKSGLVGYVLARSSMEWSIPVSSVSRGDKLSIVAQGENGRVQLVAPVEARN